MTKKTERGDVNKIENAWNGNLIAHVDYQQQPISTPEILSKR